MNMHVTVAIQHEYMNSHMTNLSRSLRACNISLLQSYMVQWHLVSIPDATTYILEKEPAMIGGVQTKSSEDTRQYAIIACSHMSDSAGLPSNNNCQALDTPWRISHRSTEVVPQDDRAAGGTSSDMRESQPPDSKWINATMRRHKTAQVGSMAHLLSVIVDGAFVSWQRWQRKW